jgi:poly(3-hydroxybutyrate) depolymerase
LFGVAEKQEVPLKRLLVALTLIAATAISACAQTPPAHDDRINSGSSGFAFVHVPSNHSAVGVLALHSLYHDYTEPMSEGWSALSDRQRFVAIYPDRPTASWNAGLCCGGAADANRDDVTWLANLILQMRIRYALTTIYLTGFSNGGMMVERLLAERPELAGKFAVWGAAPEMPRAGRWSGVGFIFHGMTDLTVPWNGGNTTINGTTYSFRPILSTPNWLIGAHLKSIQVPGYGHTPEPNWPSLAWYVLTH